MFKSIIIPSLCIFLFSCTDIVKKQSDKILNETRNEVAQHSIDQYNLALKGGDKIEIYMNASLVAESFKQANDEENYLKWKKITDEHAKQAGM